MINQFTIQRIKDAANVVDVISDFYSLKNEGGGTYSCLCPFHEDRHVGSFKVSETRNVFTCFACGAHGGPVDFLMDHENLTFVEAIKWLGAKYGIQVEGANNYHPKPCKPHAPVPPLPMLVLPSSMVLDLRPKNVDNTLCKWIRELPWNDDQKGRVERILNDYLVGHGREGHTVFWQVDEEGRVRTAKMMLYKPDGHRDKDSEHNFDYVHYVLKKAKLWDDTKFDYKTCFFGQHLVDFYPDATINLVESEKTAILCAIAYGDTPQHLWIATGGKQFMTSSRFESLIQRNRYIVCYPDHDAVDEWKDKVKAIGYDRMTINTEFMQKYWTAADGDKADIADIILRIMNEKGNSILDSMVARNPAFGSLINKFDLKITNV